MARIKPKSLCLMLLVVAGCAHLNTSSFFSEPAEEGTLAMRHKVEFFGNRLSVLRISFSDDGELMSTIHRNIRKPGVRSSPIFIPYFLQVYRLDPIGSGEIAAFHLPNSGIRSANFNRGSHEIHFVTPGRHYHHWTPNSYRKSEVPEGGKILSRDGSLLAGNRIEQDGLSAGFLYDMRLRESVWELPLSAGSPVAISPNNKILATSTLAATETFSTITFWDWRTRKPQAEIAASSTYLTRFSPDSRHVLVRLPNESGFGLYDLESQRMFHKWIISSDFRIVDTCFSLDGKRVAAAGWKETANEYDSVGVVLVWDVETGQLWETIKNEDQWGITAVAFTPDRKFIATGLPDGTVEFWGRENIEWPDFSPDGTTPSPFAADTGKLTLLPVHDSPQ